MREGRACGRHGGDNVVELGLGAERRVRRIRYHESEIDSMQ